jgi:hypothetical protein
VAGKTLPSWRVLPVSLFPETAILRMDRTEIA